jgi:hypothetical protein
MNNEIRVTLIRKPGARPASKKRPITADELSRAMSDRARQILNGEPVEPRGRPLNSY